MKVTPFFVYHACVAQNGDVTSKRTDIGSDNCFDEHLFHSSILNRVLQLLL